MNEKKRAEHLPLSLFVDLVEQECEGRRGGMRNVVFVVLLLKNTGR